MRHVNTSVKFYLQFLVYASPLRAANRAVAEESSSSGPNLPETEHETVPELGYLSLQRDGRSRYVGRSFWALIDDNNNELDTLLKDQDRYSLSERGNWPLQQVCPTCKHATGQDGLLTMTESDSSPWQGGLPKKRRKLGDIRPASQHAAALSKLLEYLPPKSTCDLLYRSFLTSIHAILPLIHLKSFDEEYNGFWAVVEGHDKSESMKGILGENPSYLSLLFAVLFGGAVSCSRDVLNSQFKVITRATISSFLREAATLAQHMVAFPRNPTIYSLMSFLIVQHLLIREEEPLSSCSYISVALRVAQAMGLHRDGSKFSLNATETEVRRRIWWHIIHTDVMTPIPSSLPPSCLSDSIYDTSMIGEVKESYIEKTAELKRDSIKKERTADVQMIYPSCVDPSMLDLRLMVAVDRYSITSTLRRILRRQFDTTPLTKTDFTSLRGEVEVLDSRISARIAQLTNICEHQRTDKAYEGDFDKLTFVEWAQLLLKLMVHKTYCVLYQPLVRDPRHTMWAQIRSDCISHCQGFIQNFCDMCTSDAFRPYHWLYPGVYQPLHAVVVLLSDLLRVPKSPEAEQSICLVDKLFTLITPTSGIVSEESGVLAERDLSDGGKEAWSLLRRLRKKTWETLGRDPDTFWPAAMNSAHCMAKSLSPNGLSGITQPQTSTTHGVVTSVGDVEYSDLLSEPLEYWDYLAESDPFQFNWINWDTAAEMALEITPLS
ncbi:Transcription factor yanR-like protein [Cladobotryum mycophilum]|uniref:Transcription factor yanR-like protein n=1 Tax=Cladobotryum mycophilum TaxID=491253 RepID=A0ABR0SQ19_9HYPO